MREVVTVEQLQKLIGATPSPAANGHNPARAVGQPAPGDFDLAHWLADHHVPIGDPKPWNGHLRWEIDPCPFNPDHTDGSAWVGQRSNGPIVAGCHHESCNWGWRDLRERYEPGCYDRKSLRRELEQWVKDVAPEAWERYQQDHPETDPLATEAPSGLLVVRYVADALADPPPEPPVLVDGLIRAGELVVVGAPRAIGKSWLAMNLATLLGRGEGRLCGTLNVRQQARVLIAQGELDPWGSYRRWKLLTGAGHPPAGVAETFDRWRLQIRKQRSTERDQEGSTSEEWIDAVLDHRVEPTLDGTFDVLVVDPWAVYYSGSENSNDETEAALDKLRDLSLRYGVTVVIFCHIGKNTEVREAEDLWRGASRLADWASTRVTLVPHYTEKQRVDQGMTRAQARRYVDVKLLRRSDPTEDFSMVLNHETGWWEHWTNPVDVAEDRLVALNPVDVAQACWASGGDWPSIRAASEALGKAQGTTSRLLAQAVRAGHLEVYVSRRGGRGHRVPDPAGATVESLDLRDATTQEGDA